MATRGDHLKRGHSVRLGCVFRGGPGSNEYIRQFRLTSKMLQYACRTAGLDCDAVFSAKTEKELFEQITQHAIEVHGLEPNDLSPELMRNVRAFIQRT
jgi:predicted small metal-binding protein